MDLPPPPVDKIDYAIAAAAAAQVVVSWVDVVDLTERVIGGALVILLLVLRIRTHLLHQRDARE